VLHAQVSVSLGCIAGPLWGGATFTNLYVMFGVMLALTVVIITAFIALWPRMLKTVPLPLALPASESTPLLAEKSAA
jgi:hypothetical protein